MNEACSQLISLGVKRVEAWTKEDDFVRNWYFKNNFKTFNSYHHVQLKGESVALKNNIKGVKIQSGFAHYIGDNIDSIKEIAEKIEECVGLEKYFLPTE